MGAAYRSRWYLAIQSSLWLWDDSSNRQLAHRGPQPSSLQSSALPNEQPPAGDSLNHVGPLIEEMPSDHPATFRDVTHGDNTCPNSVAALYTNCLGCQIFTSKAGWDPVTVLGMLWVAAARRFVVILEYGNYRRWRWRRKRWRTWRRRVGVGGTGKNGCAAGSAGSAPRHHPSRALNRACNHRQRHRAALLVHARPMLSQADLGPVISANDGIAVSTIRMQQPTPMHTMLSSFQPPAWTALTVLHFSTRGQNVEQFQAWTVPHYAQYPAVRSDTAAALQHEDSALYTTHPTSTQAKAHSRRASGSSSRSHGTVSWFDGQDWFQRTAGNSGKLVEALIVRCMSCV